FGFLESSSYRLARFDSMEHNRRIAEELWRLRDRARKPLQQALAEALRPGAEHLADYLLAARRTIQGGPALSPQGIDADRLARWVAHLRAAAKDEADLLYAWATAATKEPKQQAVALAALVEGWRKRQSEADVALKGAEMVIDYDRAGAGAWAADGLSFGPGPVRPGERRLGIDAARPIARSHDRGAAEKDAIWDVLRPAPGAENAPAPLGAIVRAGRTLRTPNFTIKSGKVFYLVRGSGRAYAAVSQHVMINGPLHGQL